MRVALDTSVICADFHFRSTDARLLWGGLGKSTTGIFIPAVVAEEVGTKHREALESALVAWQKQERNSRVWLASLVGLA